jgi:hypothetical protein
VQIGDEGGEVPAEVNKPGLGKLGCSSSASPAESKAFATSTTLAQLPHFSNLTILRFSRLDHTVLFLRATSFMIGSLSYQ